MSTHDENKRLYRIKPNIYVGWGHAQLQDWRDCNVELEITAESSDGSVLIRPAGTHGPECSIQFGHLTPSAPPLPSDEPDSDGWIAWHGGECPVDPEKLVEAKLKDNERPVSLAKYLVWSGAVFPPIIAYRVIEPASDEYSEVEQNCKGCFGPCGQCEEINDEPTDDGVLTGAALHRAIADARDDGENPEVFEIKRSDGERWIPGESWTHLIYNDAQGAAIRRKPTKRHLIDVDELVQEISRVEHNDMSIDALAEALANFIDRKLAASGGAA